MDLDHFYFYSEDKKELKILEDYGFTLTPEFRHDHQGTACRCVYFLENYIEVVYITDRDKFENHFLDQKRRVYKEFDNCDFGLGFKGAFSNLPMNEFSEYSEKFLPNIDLYLFDKSNEDLKNPYFFLMVPKNEEGVKNLSLKNYLHLEKYKYMSDNPLHKKSINSVKVFTKSKERYSIFKEMKDIEIISYQDRYFAVVDIGLGEELRLNDRVVFR